MQDIHTYPIDLISDTVTRPSAGMREAMMQAPVGDDVFHEDALTRDLEERAASLFGLEAGLFCPSGTMTNQIAVRIHTRSGESVLCEENSHVFQYEVGGYAGNAGVGIQPVNGQEGKLDADLIRSHIYPVQDWLPRTRLLVLENTANRAGGAYYSPEAFQDACQAAHQAGLAVHLDGARIFNAITETKEDPKRIGQSVDTLTFCLSKGLGAPAGSILCGSQALIREARRMRKMMGGGMRQTGILAAAGHYALDHHVQRLQEDHRHAALLGDCLSGCRFMTRLRRVYTNIVIFDVLPPYTGASFLEALGRHGIRGSLFGPQTIRFVTHLDVNREKILKTCEVLESLSAAFQPA